MAKLRTHFRLPPLCDCPQPLPVQQRLGHFRSGEERWELAPYLSHDMRKHTRTAGERTHAYKTGSRRKKLGKTFVALSDTPQEVGAPSGIGCVAHGTLNRHTSRLSRKRYGAYAMRDPR